MNERLSPHPTRSSFSRLALSLLVVLVLETVLVSLYYDRSWIGPDDGQYLHVADRLLRGQVLNRDVEEFHPGVIHFVHASAMAVFGRDAVSLRFPLMALAVAQAMLVFALFAGRGLARAATATVATSTLGVLQIATPTPSLYCLFLTWLIVAFLYWTPPEVRWRPFLAGSLLMLTFLFRQLTGVFVGMGVLTCLLVERSPFAGPSRLAGRLLLSLQFIGILAYLASSTDSGGFVLIGAWPLVATIVLWRHVSLSNRELRRTLLALAAGGVVAASPLLAYHLFQGSTAAWLQDVLVNSLTVTSLEHTKLSRFIMYLAGGVLQAVSGQSPAARINGFYWVLLPLLTVLNGVVTARAVAPGASLARRRDVILPVIAVFYSLVSVFNQIPYYLYLTAGMSLASLWWLAPRKGTGLRLLLVATALLAGVGMYYHADQPYTRTVPEILAGVRLETTPSGLERVSLWIDATEAREYRTLVALIRHETSPEDPILSLPNAPEVYFLADRPNPFRIFNTTLSLRNPAAVDAFLDDIEAEAPVLVVHNVESAYNTALTERLLEGVASDYQPIADIGPFRVFKLRAINNE